MFINRLKLLNFKGIENEEFTNWQRVNGIFGRNGACKSTIVNALQLVVLSKTPKGIKLKDFVGDNGDSFEIECDFSHLCIDYAFKMVYNGSNHKSLLFNDTLLERVNDVNNYLLTLFDPVLTLNSSFSMQGKTSSILEEEDSARLENLKKILLDKDLLDEKISEIDDLIINCRADIHSKEGELTVLENKDFIFEKELEFEDNREYLKKLIKELSIKEINNNNMLLEYEKELEKYNLLFNEFQNKILKYQDKLETINKKYEDDMFAYNKNIQELHKYNAYLSLLEDYEDKKKKLKNKIKENTVSKLDECIYTKKDKEEIENLNNNLKLNIKEYVNFIDLAKKGKCDKCGAEYHGENLEVLENKLVNYKNKVIENNKKIENINKVLNDYDILYKDYIYKKKKVIDFKNELDILKKPLKVNKVIEIDKPIKHINIRKPIFKEIKPVKPNIIDYADEINAIEKQILDIDFKIKQNNDIIKRNVLINENKIKNDNIIKDKKNEIDILYTKNNILQESKKILRKDLPVWIISKGIKFIDNKVNQFFKKSYDKYILKSIADDKNKGVQMYWYNGNKWRNVILTSGAEMNIISTAFRVALCSLQDLGLFIADEVDCFADTKRSEGMIKALCEEPFEQVIIITHSEETRAFIEEFSDSNVFVIDNGKLLNNY